MRDCSVEDAETPISRSPKRGCAPQAQPGGRLSRARTTPVRSSLDVGVSPHHGIEPAIRRAGFRSIGTFMALCGSLFASEARMPHKVDSGRQADCKRNRSDA